MDGFNLFQTYRKLGLSLHFINNTEESGILDVWRRMNSARLKVFSSLSKYLEERRLYRRDEKEQIVKDRDNLQDALRCLVNGISNMRTKPVGDSGESERSFRTEAERHSGMIPNTTGA